MRAVAIRNGACRRGCVDIGPAAGARGCRTRVGTAAVDAIRPCAVITAAGLERTVAIHGAVIVDTVACAIRAATA